MKAFLKMQLKIYFRQISNYLTPLIISFLFVVIILTLKLSAKSTTEARAIMTTSVFGSSMANFGLFTSFVIAAFVTQTIFFKYRNEGVELILFSKPISKFQIYIANLVASIIGILFSLVIMAINYLISQSIIPEATIQTVLYATWSYLFSSFLAALFVLGIGTIVQSLLELKVYQIATGVAPFIGVLFMSFIKSPSNLESYKSISDAQNKIVVPLPNKKGIGKTQIKKLEDKISNNSNSLIAMNQKLTTLDSNNPKDKKLSDYIDAQNNSLYSKLFWLNYQEFYNPIFLQYNDAMRENNKISYYKKILSSDWTTEKYKDFGLNINDLPLLKIIKKDGTILNLGLGYNIKNLSAWANLNEETSRIDLIERALTRNSKIDLSKLFFTFNAINDHYIEKLIELNEKFNSSVYDQLISDGFIDINKFKIYYEELKVYKELVDLKNFAVNLLAESLPVPKDPGPNATFAELVKYRENLAKYNNIKNSLESILFKSSLFYMCMLKINNLNAPLKEEDFYAFEKANPDILLTYKNSVFELMPLDHFVSFERKLYINPQAAIFSSILLFVVMTSIGAVIFTRKNFN